MLDEKNWIEFDSGKKCPHCGKKIMRRRLTSSFGHGFESDITCPCVVEKTRVERMQRISKGKNIIRAEMLNNSGLRKHWQSRTFDTFLCMPGQETALEAAHSLSDAFRSGDSLSVGLILCGATGSGKTHLAAAITNAIIENYPISDETAERASMFGGSNTNFSPVRFASSVDLLSKIKATYSMQSSQNDGNAQDIITDYQRAKLTVLDDLGAEKPSEWVSERLFEIVDYRYSEELPMVITTNALPEEIKDRLGSRVYDRLREMCRFIPVTTKSQRKTAK